MPPKNAPFHEISLQNVFLIVIFKMIRIYCGSQFSLLKLIINYNMRSSLTGRNFYSYFWNIWRGTASRDLPDLRVVLLFLIFRLCVPLFSERCPVSCPCVSVNRAVSPAPKKQINKIYDLKSQTQEKQKTTNNLFVQD